MLQNYGFDTGVRQKIQSSSFTRPSLLSCLVEFLKEIFSTIMRNFRSPWTSTFMAYACSGIIRADGRPSFTVRIIAADKRKQHLKPVRKAPKNCLLSCALHSTGLATYFASEFYLLSVFHFPKYVKAKRWNWMPIRSSWTAEPSVSLRWRNKPASIIAVRSRYANCVRGVVPYFLVANWVC